MCSAKRDKHNTNMIQITLYAMLNVIIEMTHQTTVPSVGCCDSHTWFGYDSLYEHQSLSYILSTCLAVMSLIGRGALTSVASILIYTSSSILTGVTHTLINHICDYQIKPIHNPETQEVSTAHERQVITEIWT